MHGSTMAESICRHMLSFRRDCQAVLQNGCTHLLSHSARYRNFNSLHPLEHCICLFLTIVGILADVSWYLIMVFISLLTNEAESLSIWYCHLDSLFVKCCSTFSPISYWVTFFLLIYGYYLYIVGICIANIFLKLVFWWTEVPKVCCTLFYFILFFLYGWCSLTYLKSLPYCKVMKLSYRLKVLEFGLLRRNRPLSVLWIWSGCLCFLGGRNPISFLAKLAQHHWLKRPLLPPLHSRAAPVLYQASTKGLVVAASSVFESNPKRVRIS